MVIRRDKLLKEYIPTDFVKYFARKYLEINKIEFDVVYARDCVLMGRVIDYFERAKQPKIKIFAFIDKMFLEYPKRERSEPIDIRFLAATCFFYLHGKGIKKSLKVKTPTVLPQELKAWLQEEKKKWLKGR